MSRKQGQVYKSLIKESDRLQKQADWRGVLRVCRKGIRSRRTESAELHLKLLIALYFLGDIKAIGKHISECIIRFSADTAFQSLFQPLDLASFWLNSAIFAQYSGDYSNSDKYFKHALSHAEAAFESKNTENRQKAGLFVSKILYIWSDQSYHQGGKGVSRAGQQLKKAQQILLQCSAVDGSEQELNLFYGKFFFFQGRYNLFVRKNKKQLENALKQFEVSAKHLDESGDSAERKKSLLYAAWTSALLNQFSKAHNFLAKANSHEFKTSEIDSMYTLMITSWVYFLEGRKKESLPLAVKAGKILMKQSWPDLIVYLNICVVLAVYVENRKSTNEYKLCTELLAKGIHWVEKCRALLKTPEEKALFHRKWAFLYRLKRNLHLEAGEFDKALVSHIQNMGRLTFDHFFGEPAASSSSDVQGTIPGEKTIRKLLNDFLSANNQYTLVFPFVRKLHRKPALLVLNSGFHRKSIVYLEGDTMEKWQPGDNFGNAQLTEKKKAFQNLVARIPWDVLQPHVLILQDRNSQGAFLHKAFLRRKIFASLNWSLAHLSLESKQSARSGGKSAIQVHLLCCAADKELVGKEYNDLKAVLGKKSIKKSELNRKNLLKALENSEYVHIISHADAHNIYSSIPQNGQSPDVVLQDNELWSLKLSARLVYISACNAGSAVYKEAVENEPEGLSSGLLAAGVRSVIAPERTIQPVTARAVSVSFYEKLKAGRSVFEAWGETALELGAKAEKLIHAGF